SGALPLALVIHLTYQDPENDLIYIRHFHSTTNFDQSDPAGKFREAVAALVAFIDERGLDNPALASFRAYHQEGRFPGLGMIKKLSMQNHLYVMHDALVAR
ncbi:MAG TPA: sce7725 family protein, partial [Micromonospora sp.]